MQFPEMLLPLLAVGKKWHTSRSSGLIPFWIQKLLSVLQELSVLGNRECNREEASVGEIVENKEHKVHVKLEF